MLRRFALGGLASVAIVGAVLVTDATPAGDQEPAPDGAAVVAGTDPTPAISDPPESSTSTAAPSTTAAPTTEAPDPPRVVTLAFTGDMIPHAPVLRQADAYAASGYDFAPMLARVAPILSAVDVAICHLETPLAVGEPSGYPVFNGPAEMATAIAGAGYDGCSLASNHSYDQGRDGVVDTVATLEAAGLRFAGMARTPAEDVAPVIYSVDGIDIAHLSFTYGLNGFSLPADAPHLVDVIDPPEIVEEARLAREAGADVVIVSMHWGNEYQHEPTDVQQAQAMEVLTTPEVDLIIGHHAHVVQPIDKVGAEYVVYGVGNFLTNQSANCCTAATQDGVIVTVEVAEAADGSFTARPVSFTPTWVDRSDYTVLPVAATMNDPATSADLRSVLAGSWDRTLAAIEAERAGLFGIVPDVVPS